MKLLIYHKYTNQMKLVKPFSYAVLVCMLLGILGAQAQHYTPLYPSGNIATEPVVTIPMEPMDSGKFVPTWESLKQYGEAPEWYQDAKFGIWAHWGPQCQPEQGDWYARFMYYSGSQRNWFTSAYGSDTKLGFKEVINDWKAESWNPESIVELYKNAGAKYFFALGNH